MGRNAEADKEVDEERERGEVRGADLEPIGVVQRELTRPDGTTVVVEVPVYPPFRLAESPGGRKPARNRSAPSIKGKRGRPRGLGKS
jgi:hypothetical protein